MEYTELVEQLVNFIVEEKLSPFEHRKAVRQALAKYLSKKSTEELKTGISRLRTDVPEVLNAHLYGDEITSLAQTYGGTIPTEELHNLLGVIKTQQTQDPSRLAQTLVAATRELGSREFVNLVKKGMPLNTPIEIPKSDTEKQAPLYTVGEIGNTILSPTDSQRPDKPFDYKLIVGKAPKDKYGFNDTFLLKRKNKAGSDFTPIKRQYEKPEDIENTIKNFSGPVIDWRDD